MIKLCLKLLTTFALVSQPAFMVVACGQFVPKLNAIKMKPFHYNLLHQTIHQPGVLDLEKKVGTDITNQINNYLSENGLKEKAVNAVDYNYDLASLIKDSQKITAPITFNITSTASSSIFKSVASTPYEIMFGNKTDVTKAFQGSDRPEIGVSNPASITLSDIAWIREVYEGKVYAALRNVPLAKGMTQAELNKIVKGRNANEGDYSGSPPKDLKPNTNITKTSKARPLGNFVPINPISQIIGTSRPSQNVISNMYGIQGYSINDFSSTLTNNTLQVNNVPSDIDLANITPSQQVKVIKQINKAINTKLQAILSSGTITPGEVSVPNLQAEMNNLNWVTKYSNKADWSLSVNKQSLINHFYGTFSQKFIIKLNQS